MYICEGKKFSTIQGAIKYANSIFAKTGVVVAIQLDI
jgi:hypothetical protein